MTTPDGRAARLRAGAVRVVLLAFIGVGTTTGGCGSANGLAPYSPKDYVLAPDKVHYGGSYSDWSVLWWQWALEQSWIGHPLFDTTGVDAGKQQVEPVWFIGGIFGSFFQPSNGSAERTITIPGDVALFFPVINGEYDNQVCIPVGWTPLSAAELATLAFNGFSQVQDVYCTLDGVDLFRSPDLAGVADFRAISGTFSASMPADHIGVGSCGDAPGAIALSPAVSDGIWVMLDPLPPGQHTITFGGKLPTIGGPGFFQLAIIYHITVLP